MSLGFGLFLSSILFAIVFLFNITKDRWNWKKIVKISAASTVMIAVIIAGGISIEEWNASKNRRKVNGIDVNDIVVIKNEYMDIKLSHSRADVKFVRGGPNSEEEDEKDIWTYFGSFHDESNNVDIDCKLSIKFLNNKVHAIYYTGAHTSISPISNINIGSKYDDVISKFGEPSLVSESIDHLERALFFDHYNTFFKLERNEVAVLGLYNPILGRPNIENIIFREKKD